jgi:hypothetical protein
MEGGLFRAQCGGGSVNMRDRTQRKLLRALARKSVASPNLKICFQRLILGGLGLYLV